MPAAKPEDPEKPAEPGAGGGATPPPPPDDFHKFLVGLATDPAKLGTFIKDPDASMKAAGLSDADQAVLKSGHPAIIHGRLSGQAAAPVVVPQIILLVVDMAPAEAGQGGEQPSVRNLTSQGSQPMYPTYPSQYPMVMVTVAGGQPPQIHPIYPPPIYPPQIHPIYPPPIYPPLQVVVHPQVVHPQIVTPPQIYPQIHPQIVHPQIVHPQIVHPQIVAPQIVYPQIYPQIFPQIIAPTPGPQGAPMVVPPLMLMLLVLAQQQADALRAQYQPYLNLHPVFPVFPQIHPLIYPQIFPQITPPVFPQLLQIYSAYARPAGT
jgi:hypothetical protein